MTHNGLKTNRINDKRNSMLRKNIFLSAVLKVISLCCSLLIVPVTLDYLDSEIYGIWLTMSSILYWFSFFDIGLGNGMRNYLTQAISTKDYKSGREYISTTLIILSGIALLISILTIGILPFIDINVIFNTNSILNKDLCVAMIIAIIFTSALFVVKNIGLIFVALQKYAINDFLIVTGNVVALLIIYIFTLTTDGNLLYVIIVFTATPVLVFVLASFPIFTRYPQLKPSVRHFNKRLANKIIGKGLGFFFIQITSCLVIYGGANIFIIQFCGPTHVTIYNIAFKYFHLIAIAYTIIISPLWNAYTDAYIKNDMKWINKTFLKSLKTWLLTVLLGIIMILFSPIFYFYWIGDNIKIPTSVSICVFIFICAFNLNNSVTYLLNGLNKIRIQIYTSIVMTVLFIITIATIGKNLNIELISLCMASSYMIMGMIHFYQCKLLINNKAKGLWNK